MGPQLVTSSKCSVLCPYMAGGRKHIWRLITAMGFRQLGLPCCRVLLTHDRGPADAMTPHLPGWFVTNTTSLLLCALQDNC
jgi:hypothetical protein